MQISADIKHAICPRKTQRTQKASEDLFMFLFDSRPLRVSRTIILDAYIKVTGFLRVQERHNKNIRVYLRSSVD
jgi:hypothetical protein